MSTDFRPLTQGHRPLAPKSLSPVLAKVSRPAHWDWQVFLPVALLTLFGLVMIFSAGGKTYFLRQLIWVPVAVSVLFICYRIPRRLLYTFSYPLLAFAVILLVAVLLVGHGPARRWFDFGPVNFQPSELAKIACVLALAHYLSERKQLSFRVKELAVPVLLALVPFLLVLIEPDLGSSVVFVVILGAMMFWHGVSLFHIFLLFSPVLSLFCSLHLVSWIAYFVLLGALLLWQGKTWEVVYGFGVNVLVGLLTPVITSHIHEYQKARVTTFLMPWLDPKGMGWNVIQSLISVGSGRLLGKGLLAGTQKRLSFLPNRHTDFIFSCTAEELGFVGATAVLFLLGYLSYRFLMISFKSRDSFGTMMAFGLTAIFTYHALVNTGMVLGLAPITGIALPFLTYGGSPLLLNFAIVGLILNVEFRAE
jgi:rod shape determining protein RodA